MEQLSGIQWIDWIVNAPLISLVVAAGVAGYFKKWVWGWQLREMTEDRNFYRDRLFAKTTELEGQLQSERNDLRRMLERGA